ncbi:MAG: hypothetical protein GTN53_20515, partial [Candidatus Aminicenantes bacterium]|nr:hypothetical protein [Candidatus Aminicenantes bacterium]NIQ68886.1 hypothetical protein [Candidatus Aminicenantes bacterium]NIT24887.1 hypothetical protein [Candidatus Aminicenantes bacterium]
MQNRNQTIREKLIHDVELLFGEDKKRIEHAKKVMGYVKELLKKEKGDYH